jgi:hypothetical protein
MLAAAILVAFFTCSALHCEKPEYFKFLVRVIPPCLYLYLYICYCPLRNPNWNKILYCIVLYCIYTMHFTSFRVNLFLPLVSKPLTKYFFFIETTFKPFFLVKIRDKFLFLKNLKIRKCRNKSISGW